MKNRTVGIAVGFALIELMIVVAIIAILAAIAYPSYNRYVMRTRRAEAKDLAMRVASAEERYFTNLNRYTVNIAGDLQLSDISEGEHYKVGAAVANAAQTYTLSLTPQGGQVGDSCGVLTINNTGFKDAPTDNGTNGKCW